MDTRGGGVSEPLLLFTGTAGLEQQPPNTSRKEGAPPSVLEGLVGAPTRAAVLNVVQITAERNAGTWPSATVVHVAGRRQRWR